MASFLAPCARRLGKVLLGLTSLSLASAGVDPWAGLYVRQPSLSASMLATRARYAQWSEEQKPLRGTLSWGRWQVAEEELDPSCTASRDLLIPAPSGKPRWSERPDWRDGALLAAAGEKPGRESVWLARTVSAPRAVLLTAGFGGGDRIEVWLNGAPLASQNTRLETKRYGTSLRLDGDRRSQFLLALPLREGENLLLVHLRQQPSGLSSPARPEFLQFFFSPAPDPVPRFWEQLRQDFPPAQNRLLDTVPAGWFRPGGWFDQAGQARLERDLLASLQAAPDLPATLESCVDAVDLHAARQELARLRLAVTELERTASRDYPGETFLSQLDQCARDLSLQPAATLLRDLAGYRRAMLVDANPLLRGATLLLAKRFTYDSQHYYDDYYHGPTSWGGNLCEISLADGQTRELAPQLAGGIFDRYDLSADAQTLVFGYRAPKPEGYRIYETRLDGTGLRQITQPPEDDADRMATYSLYSPDALQRDPRLYGHWTDDMHPCYLPDGGIAFVSSRCERSVLCGGHALTTACLHRMNRDGSSLRPLSQGALSEFTPALLEDGRILYNRWEYVYKGIAAIQPLWAMRPDGSAPEEIYGDNIANPGAFVQARQVPGRPDLVVCTGCGHEPLAVGAILLLDLHRDKRSPSAMTSLTPEVESRGLRGLFQFRNGEWREDVYGPFYCDPYPLSDKFFLVSCNPSGRYNDPKGYGIFLLDAFGNRVEVYRDPEISCWQPMLRRPRKEPPVLASAPPAGPGPGPASTEATLILADVTKGLDGVKPGTVKWLRVMEQIPRPWSVHCDAKPGDDFPGQMVAISYYTHIWVALLHGIVPVHPDGSAHFTVPANRSLFFQALDENFMEVQKMRTFINLKPGESRSCIGCHEPRTQSPAPAPPAALQCPPVRPAAQPGESAPRPIHYATDVQPTLDRHCVRCHGATEPGGGLRLDGELTDHFSRSYEELLTKGQVNFIQEWTGPRLKDPPACFTVGGSMAHAAAVPPYTYGSHRSKVVEVIRQGHYGAQLSREEFVRLVTWVDANAPYYGSYFGRRHLRYQDRPDFRPVPTLASASGILPVPVRPPHQPAESLAWWPFDGGTAIARSSDATGQGHEARIAGAKPAEDAPAGQALAFDGRSHVDGPDLGWQESLSVALWVKAGALRNTWNPLLFTSTGETSAFHFSLLQNGTPNVAIHVGGKSWLHRRARRTLADGVWHHLAVVCDARSGGRMQFYLDGQRDADVLLDAGVPLDLRAFRLGAWSAWQNQPDNNFHGCLDEVRLYRGLLTRAEVASLARCPAPLRTASAPPP